MSHLTKLHVAGYKSLRDVELDFRPINVLIGANGSGKSNLVSLFKMLQRAAWGELQLFVGSSGGANVLLHYGSRVTDQILIDLERSAGAVSNRYRAVLVAADPDTLVLQGAGVAATEPGVHERAPLRPSGQGRRELDQTMVDANAADYIKGWHIFHFHDTSQHSGLRKQQYVHDTRALYGDARNLAPYLHMLRQAHPAAYRRIVDTIRLAAPLFGDFVIDRLPTNEIAVILNWRERGQDYLFGPHQLSDGTLRFAALTTLLIQPPELRPSLIIIDEPELGLHPYALTLLASMVRSAAEHTQVLLSTQSTRLVDEFEPEDIVVVDRAGGETTCSRLDAEELLEWLEEYSVSELWEKNVIGGRPAR